MNFEKIKTVLHQTSNDLFDKARNLWFKVNHQEPEENLHDTDLWFTLMVLVLSVVSINVIFEKILRPVIILVISLVIVIELYSLIQSD